MCRSYFFKVAALSCQNPLQAAPEPGTGNFHLRRVNRLNFNTNFSVTNTTISKALGIPFSKVSDIRKGLKETMDVSAVLKRKTKSKEDARKTRDPNFIAKVQNMIDEDPTKSMRRMSVELNTSKWTINQTIRQDMKCKSYRLQTGQILTEATRRRRVLKCTTSSNAPG